MKILFYVINTYMGGAQSTTTPTSTTTAVATDHTQVPADPVVEEDAPDAPAPLAPSPVVGGPSDVTDIAGLFLQLSPFQFNEILKQLDSSPSLQSEVRDQDDIAQIHAACMIDPNGNEESTKSLIHLINIFDINHIKKLLQIFQNGMQTASKVLETQISEGGDETVADTLFKDAVKQNILIDMLGFTGNFSPQNWINPVNAPDPAPNVPNQGWGSKTHPLSILIRTIAPGEGGVLPFDNYREFNNAVNDRDPIVETTKYWGFDYKTLFAAALAYDIDPYDPLPDINIVSYAKSEYFTIITEILNVTLMAIICQYTLKIAFDAQEDGDESSSQSRAEMIPKMSNLSALTSSHNETYRFSDILIDKFKTNNNTVRFHAGNQDDPCGFNEGRSDYYAFIQHYNTIVTETKNYMAGVQTVVTPGTQGEVCRGGSCMVSSEMPDREMVTFIECAHSFVINGIDKLKELDTSPSGLDEDHINNLKNACENWRTAGGDGNPCSDYAAAQCELHPNVCNFVINLINFVISLELHLKLGNYSNINLPEGTCNEHALFNQNPREEVEGGFSSQIDSTIRNMYMQAANVNLNNDYYNPAQAELVSNVNMRAARTLASGSENTTEAETFIHVARNALFEYLLSQGVDPDRLLEMGYEP